MSIDDLAKICDELRSESPYPPDVFIRPTKEQWAELPEMFARAGMRQDPFFAEAMAIAYENALHYLEKRMRDKIESLTLDGQ